MKIRIFQRLKINKKFFILVYHLKFRCGKAYKNYVFLFIKFTTTRGYVFINMQIPNNSTKEKVLFFQEKNVDDVNLIRLS